jgi:hypothetical protein
MNPQLIAVFVALGLAVAYVTWQAWKTWRGSPVGGCGSGCGKCTATEVPAPKGRIGLPQV